MQNIACREKRTVTFCSTQTISLPIQCISKRPTEPLLKKEPQKPALRKKDNMKEFEKFVKRRVFENALLSKLQKGTSMLQYGRGSKKSGKIRKFWVSKDGTELVFQKESIKRLSLQKIMPNLSALRRIPLAEVERILHGPRTKGFEDYNLFEGNPENCFSLVLSNGKCVELECLSRDDFMLWFQGLQCLCPLSSQYLSRAKINWQRFHMKVFVLQASQNLAILEILQSLTRPRSDSSLLQEYSKKQKPFHSHSAIKISHS